MSFLHQPRLASAAAALAGALLLLGLTPVMPLLERIDRQLTASVVGAPLSEIHGLGSAESPRYRQAYAAPKQIADARLLVVDDDSEGILEASPPTPSDMAVVISNLRKQGIEQFGISYALGWQTPDRISLMAMKQQMDEKISTILSLPLSYGSAGEPVRQPFLRASLSLNQVQGNTSLLPVVNRVAISDPELGGDKALAGFSQLVNEGSSALKAPLLARWNERIVLSQPLVMAVVRLGIPFSEISVKLGQTITLGRNGPAIQITPRGEIAQELQPHARKYQLSQIFGDQIPDDFWKLESPLYIIDQRSTASPETLAWNETLLKTDAAIRRSPNPGKAHEYPRLDALLELGGLFAVALITGAVVAVKRKPLGALLATLLTVAFLGLLGFLASRQMPMPLPLALISIPAIALAVRVFTHTVSSVVEPVSLETEADPPSTPQVPATPVGPEPPAESEPQETPAPPAKKAARKKSASKSKSSRKSSEPPP